ncbi:MAG: S8 family serine peptidase [Opitutales bacterium]|nr:S8 family serine peptidase [Opitutales bacterium]
MNKIDCLTAIAVLYLAPAITEAGTFTYRSEGETITLTIADNEFATLTQDYTATSSGSSAQAVSDTVWTKVTLSDTSTLSQTMTASTEYSSGYVSPVLEDVDGQDIYIRPSIWVSFPSGTGATEVNAVLSQISGATSTTLVSSPYIEASQPGPNETLDLQGGYDIYCVEVSTTNGQTILNQIETLTASPNAARSIEPAFSFTASVEMSAPNDTYWPLLWNLESSQNYDINALETWDTTRGYSSVKVAVFDLGIQNNHPDLPVADGYNATPVGTVNEWYPTEDWQNHGTAVAGFINATIDNSLGVVGVAPDVTLLSVKIAYQYNYLTKTFRIDDDRVVAAINWAREQHCRVTNHSWGRSPTAPSAKIAEALENARIGSNMLHFASAGNNGRESSTDRSLRWPATASSVIAVGAIGKNGSRSDFSAFGSKLALTAPGSGLITTDRTGADGYATADYAPNMQGTSFSSPIAAACAALVISKNPALTAAEVEAVLCSTARDLGTTGHDSYYGYGLVQPQTALDAIDPYVFFGAANSIDGWKKHEVYGWLKDEAFPWFWHAQHGWQWTSSTDPPALIVYDLQSNDWFYTDISESGYYPYIYRYSNDTWYYYFPDTSEPRAFYNMNTGATENF